MSLEDSAELEEPTDEDAHTAEPQQFVPVPAAYYRSAAMPYTDEQVVAETNVMQNVAAAEAKQDTDTDGSIPVAAVIEEDTPLSAPLPVEEEKGDLADELKIAIYEAEVYNLTPSWLPEGYALTDVSVVSGDEPEDKKKAVVTFSSETGEFVVSAVKMKYNELVPAIAPERLVELEDGLKIDMEHVCVLEGETVVSDELKARFVKEGTFYHINAQGVEEEDFLRTLQSLFAS